MIEMVYNNTGELSSEPSSHIPHWHDPDGPTLTVNEGEGAYVFDEDGDAYFDLISSLYCVNAGHDNSKIADAVTEQLRRIPYVASSQGNETRDRLAEKLVEVSPEPLSDVVFSVSGSEANELAMQFARKSQDASKVLTRWRSYHGSTYGAGSLTGEQGTRNAVETHASTSGAVKFLPPTAHDSPFDADSPAELAEKAADHVEFVIRNEGPDTVAALFMEPVGGSSGGYPAPPGYFERLREICDTYDVLLVADEVITGFGRCGEMFGMQTEGVAPDMITFAKGVTSGYVPLAGVIASPEVAETIRDGTNLGQTFAGHPAACAAAVAAIEEYEDGLLDNAQRLAPVLERELESLAASHDVVADVRGRGFLWAVVIEDPETGEPFVDPLLDEDGVENPAEDVVREAKDRGVLLATGRPGNQLMVCPPLCADESDLVDAIGTLDDAMDVVFD